MNAHNNVNKMKNKSQWTLEQVFKHYQEIFLKPPSNSKESSKIRMPYKIDFKTIIICLLILIIIYLMTKKNT